VKLVPLDLSFLGLGVVSFSYAEILFALTFPATDIVSEIWGGKRARNLVYGGVCTYVITMILLSIATQLPAPTYWAEQDATYSLLFTSAPRTLVASLTAMSISQLLDISLYNWIRGKTGDKFLWLRNNGSTLISQAVDTVLFYTIAFYGLMPNEALFSLLIGNYLLKIVFAAVDTPLVYAVIAWIKKDTPESTTQPQE
ncbi:MAG: queuosine precursor transporter, partial [Verrucomicrobiota bacterium]